MPFLENFSQFILKFANEYIFDRSEINFLISFSFKLIVSGLFLLFLIRLNNVPLFQFSQKEM